MWPTLLLVVLFVAVMAALPWLVRRLQQKNLLPRGMGMAVEPLPCRRRCWERWPLARSSGC